MNRYSSRRDDAFSSLLKSKLPNALKYDRIAGYFSSSLLEIAGEAIDTMDGNIRIVCNSDLDVDDVQTAKLAAEAIKNEWCSSEPEKLPKGNRFERLYNLLVSGKVEIRVLPRERFGLIHGKAGVITMKDGTKTSFLGSINESKNGWKSNYELVWEDDSKESVEWVQEEFDILWNDKYAVDLKNVEYIIEDIKRISNRQEVSCEEWRESPSVSSALVESSIYRKGFGLWEHQKYFINKVFTDHLKPSGARYVLADQVGLGKTVQLALSAQVMCLYGDKPVLVLVPKTLMIQWQDELLTLLGIPSAYWDGNKWVDEIGNEYYNDINKCPRRIGIVSQGIISNGSSSCMELKRKLLSKQYECVICDESHRARRRNLGDKNNTHSPVMNNLYEFLFNISKKTHSMLLATATPVQMYTIEAYDLLNILSSGSDSVLGNEFSRWRNKNTAHLGLKLITDDDYTVNDVYEFWEWFRNPIPNGSEHIIFDILRRNIDLLDTEFTANFSWSSLSEILKNRIKCLMDEDFFKSHNPYIRHIIRRERKFLEEKINPNTGQPYLKPINVILYGEDESLTLQGYLKDAYNYAELFCDELKKRNKSSGFIKTLLLRRIGSSMIAGYNTGIKMLTEWNSVNTYTDYDDLDYDCSNSEKSDIKDLTSIEREILQNYVKCLELALESNEFVDPKYHKVIEILEKGVIDSNGDRTPPWLELGCIIFSQYYDTANWVSKNISLKFKDTIVGLYAGGDKTRIYINGIATKTTRDELKSLIKENKVKILIGTDAASEGLNLQTLGALINLDLPWNPTRLEQRKGRIQRIGQKYDNVYIYNLKYKDSVEDKVHTYLSHRFKGIFSMFGQLPDVLMDVWVKTALKEDDDAKKIIDNIPKKHPFAVKYNEDIDVHDWDTCENVLKANEIDKAMLTHW